jgi:predicted methyltransferase
MSELDDLGLGHARYDLIFLALAYHDLYFNAEFWPQPGRDRFFLQVRAALKPDGTLVVIDHAAVPGSGARDAQLLHRIDEDYARRDIEAAGFELVAASDVLRNSHDDRRLEVFDPAIRHRTDRFVYRFRRSPDP